MNAEALLKQLNIDKEHKPRIEEVAKYMEEHRIQELFNVGQMHNHDFYRRYSLTYYTQGLPMQRAILCSH